MALMKPKKRQKLCYNCEGEVDLDVIVCPFCAADLRAEKPELSRSSFSPAVTSVKQLHAENSLYPSSFNRSSQQEAPPVRQQEAPPIAIAEEEITQESFYEEDASNISKMKDLWNEKAGKSLVLSLFLFTLGVQLFLLGVLFVLFSQGGVMILKWDASLWFLYIFASIPLLLFGYRSLNKL